jgi:hypothetical protein
MSECEKQPIGLMPEWIHEERANHARIIDILDAISRYSDANIKPPTDWYSELDRRKKNSTNF